MTIKVKGLKGLQKKCLVVSILTAKGEEKRIAVAEVENLKLDLRRKRKNKKYVELARFGVYPYISVTKNVVTGKLSWNIRAGNHHYWLPFNYEDNLKLLLLALYSYSNTLEYKSIRDIILSVPMHALKYLERKVAAAKAAYKKHLAKVKQYGFKL